MAGQTMTYAELKSLVQNYLQNQLNYLLHHLFFDHKMNMVMMSL